MLILGSQTRFTASETLGLSIVLQQSPQMILMCAKVCKALLCQEYCTKKN